jgi:uncharacterized membrane protein YcaP (DUF421 family)
MWTLAEPWWHLIARAAIVYVFLLILLRLTGKRQVGQLAPFDLVMLLVISNTVQNAMNAGDNSVAAGLILATVVVAINYAVAYATYRSKRLEALIEGEPQVLIHDGRVNELALRRQRLTRHELMASLREAGCAAIDEVEAAILENNGHISVVPRTRAS